MARAFLLDIVDPFGDLDRVGSGLERGPILIEPPVAVGEFLGGIGLGRLQWVGRLSGQCPDRRFDPARRERGQQPFVEGLEDLGFTQVDHLGMVDLVGQGVLLREPAPVIGLIVVPVALHAPFAVPAEQHAAEDVRAARAGAVWLVGGASVAACGEDLLDLLELLHGDQRLVYLMFGPDPGATLVPAHLGGVAECDIVDVQQDLVLALLVPHLAAGVARVGDDDAHSRLGPGDLATVAVAGRIARRWRRDALPGEVLGDVEDAAPGDELREDPLHDQRVDGMSLQPFEAPTVGGLGRVGVWPRIHQLVPVWWPATEVTPFGRGDGAHRRPDSELDPVAFAFGQSSEHAHDHVVGFVGGVDRTAHFRHPQRDAEVLEQREGQAVLVSVEGPVRLPDHHGVEAAGRVLEFLDQRGRVRTARPWDGTRPVDVEELHHDLAATWSDQRAGAAELPRP